jgi:hypothetical protein
MGSKSFVDLFVFKVFHKHLGTIFSLLKLLRQLL